MHVAEVMESQRSDAMSDGALCFHAVEDPRDATGPVRGYFDFGDGNILPCGLTETQRVQAVTDSIRRTRVVRRVTPVLPTQPRPSLESPF